MSERRVIQHKEAAAEEIQRMASKTGRNKEYLMIWEATEKNVSKRVITCVPYW